MKLITFSLWGQDPKYLHGSLKNAELAKTIYPDWICRFYTAASVPSPVINNLKSMDNVEVVQKNSFGDWKSMFWRFEPASEPNVEVMISRDLDSRLGEREKAAVDSWLESDKGFHIMRDHPWHKFPVLGGMWGIKRGTLPNMKELIDQFAQEDEYGTDYKFFAQIIMPLINDNVMVHDEFFSGQPFPKPRKDYEFVGEVFDESDNSVLEHTIALRKYYENR